MDSLRALGALAARCLQLALLTGASLWATTTGALAATNAVGYSVATALSAAPSPGSPANLGYHWTHHLDTTPPAQQPDTSPSLTIFFASAVKSNARYFPSCGPAAIDGALAVPADCQDALIGTGTATMYAGTPGTPRANSVREDMTVSLFNGRPTGPSVLMVVSSAPGAPVTITNRVVPGTVVPANDPYGFGIRFDVPRDLQNQLGLSMAFTDIDATISGTPRQITSRGETRFFSYVEATYCPESLPVQETVDFRAPSGDQTTVTSDGYTPCTVGMFPDDPRIPTAPITTDVAFADAPGPPRITAPTGLLTAASARNGSFGLRGVTVACPPTPAGRCAVTAEVRPALARVHLTIAPGARATVRMQLTKAGKKAMRRKRLTVLSVRLLVSAANGLTSAKRLRVAVRAAA